MNAKPLHDPCVNGKQVSLIWRILMVWLQEMDVPFDQRATITSCYIRSLTGEESYTVIPHSVMNVLLDRSATIAPLERYAVEFLKLRGIPLNNSHHHL